MEGHDIKEEEEEEEEGELNTSTASSLVNSEAESDENCFPPNSTEEEDSEENVMEEEDEEEGGQQLIQEKDQEEYDAMWSSKDKKILWSPSNEVSAHYVPPRIPSSGPTLYAIARIKNPETAFNLFFPDDIIQLILDMTNLHGKRTVTNWAFLTAQELRAYMGLLILAGMYRSKNEATLSLWDKEMGRPVFAETMTQGRFSHINRALCFDDEKRRPQGHQRNQMFPIEDLWWKWTSLLPKMFYPGRDICIDEQLVPFSGRCPFKQYMPSKPAKYGLKIWALCDVATSYAWNLEVYTGEPTEGQRETNVGMRVVLDLCRALEGHTVTVDHFFSSIPLALELKKKKMTLVGTIRKNKREIPPQLLQLTSRLTLSSKFAFTSSMTLVSYVPRKRKNVLLLSTKHHEPEVSGEQKKKPKIILDYNKCKGAVDNLDHVSTTFVFHQSFLSKLYCHLFVCFLQACSVYSTRRRASRWPMTLFYHMLDMSCFNAFVLYTQVNPNWNSQKLYKRRIFLSEVALALVQPEIQRRRPKNLTVTKNLTVAKVVVDPRRRKQCAHCVKPLRASNFCSQCGKPICSKHSKPTCFNC